ncbi:hypothetical protein ANRL4_04511 [Anaerolineae bacterium]|nr:hypothetical protein ANRL4_04511 [Anaerolineae bacterium]
MAYRMVWIVPNRVLLTTFEGDVTQIELQQFVADIRDRVRSGEAPVYHISNSLNMGKVHLSLKALGDLIKNVSIFAELGAQIDINKPRSLNAFLASVGSQLIRVKSYMVQSLDEAVQVVKRVDPALENALWQMPPLAGTEETRIPSAGNQTSAS